ncbi:MAG: serine hydrolase [Planctomycetota bacterium]|nr:serine hydrolase [Planctomycetota bacterium]
MRSSVINVTQLIMSLNDFTCRVAVASLFILAFMSGASPTQSVSAESPNPAKLSSPDKAATILALENAIRPLVKDYKGDVAVALYHFESDTHWSIRGDEVMPTASLIKLPVMIEAYRQVEAGKLKLDQRIEMTKDDMVQGSGILTTHFSPGTNISLRDAIRLMIVYSDNTATNLVVDAIGLPSTTKTMTELGFPETQLNGKVYRRDLSIAPERSKKYGLGSTTANEMVTLLTRLKRGEFAKPESNEAILDHLVNCDDTSCFPLLMPKDVKVGHKTGAVTRVRTDAGLLMGKGCTIALCVLIDNNADTRWTDDNVGNRLCAEISKTVYETLAPKETEAKSDSSDPSEMKIGATGELVEALQRTLNARSNPSVNVSVDGDFGPGTEAAVKAFQSQKKIKPSGIVNAATWTALGALIEKDEPAPAPAAINEEKLPIAAADDPFGPPQVTCAGWTIVDAATGEEIASKNADQKLHIASTTKIMTAYVALQYAASQPEVLKEMLTFSKRADNTTGSTSGVRAGEQLPVGELLYGLMLPSGNDASVAIAEFFGRKFSSDDKVDDIVAYDRFIERMNIVAADLGMNQTHFTNTHGLTDETHLSTVADMAKLTKAALSIPLFRELVSCRQHGCEVMVPGGYKRNVLWQNTNRLLGIEGYTGIKTGTTNAAGACLVSSSQREGRELIVVTLKSADSDARYIDARNLHAFGWRKLTEKK